ncbi:MAG: hypothetical protein Q4C02_10415 [Eubacteriales bacterium]|nr:hypothetical protein [Sarcina sp.]MBR2729632.1 hypothetical protein [Lachnospiraceae bacterium]MDO4418674.1 hypothetical protein [Eubacteriales bacterium]
MTVKELKKFFKDHLVPARLYNMKGGHHKNRICISNDRNGWEVYFSEGKSKIGLMQFATESEACQRMKDEVCKVMEQIYGLSWKGLA